jgi:hypothetical protein
MVDRILASARGPALQAEELRDEPLVVQQFDAPGVEQRERLDVNLRLGQLARLVGDAAVHLETLGWPETGVAIPGHAMDAIALEESDELQDNIVGGKRRPALPYRVDHRTVRSGGSIKVGDGERHAVRAAT